MRNRIRSIVSLAALRGAVILLAAAPLPAAPPSPPATASAASPSASAPAVPDAVTMRIYMIDVGQGDSTLVVFPGGRTMLIDAGEKEAVPRIIALLTRLGVRRLDYLVASHNHPDHTGGFARLIEEGYADSSTTAYSWSDREWRGLSWRRVRPGDVLYDDAGATVTCYAIGSRVLGGVYVPPDGNINARSMVLNITYKGFDYLSGGDLTGAGKHPNLEGPVADALVSRGARIDVYKVHHHGSRSSSNLYFLKKIMPEFAMLSVGDDNPYGHPTRTVLKRLNNPSVRVKRIFQTESGDGATAPNVTVANGQIAVTTDGVEYRFSNEGPGSTPVSYGPYPVDEFAGVWPMFRATAAVPR